MFCNIQIQILNKIIQFKNIKFVIYYCLNYVSGKIVLTNCKLDIELIKCAAVKSLYKHIDCNVAKITCDVSKRGS